MDRISFYEKTARDYNFKITPFSFFQPNTKGAEVLYETVREYIGDIHDLTVFDLFSGTGTISQVLAPVAKKSDWRRDCRRSSGSGKRECKKGTDFLIVSLLPGMCFKCSMK